jgi:two-component system sensor histidine kinase RegB
VAALPVRLPPRAITQALRSLVTNAQDASPPEAPVVVAVRAGREELTVAIADRGGGMTSEVLARIGEPFYTTKSPGRGMGLGLFLARAVIEGVGGNLAIDSQIGEGTRVTVTVPLDVQAESRGPAGRRATSERSPMLSKVVA